MGEKLHFGALVTIVVINVSLLTPAEEDSWNMILDNPKVCPVTDCTSQMAMYELSPCFVLLQVCEFQFSIFALKCAQAAHQDQGPAHSILIDMECLAMLNRLPDAVESLTADLQNQVPSALCTPLLIHIFLSNLYMYSFKCVPREYFILKHFL